MVCSLTHGYTKIVKLFLLSFQIFFVFFFVYIYLCMDLILCMAILKMLITTTCFLCLLLKIVILSLAPISVTVLRTNIFKV